MAGLDARIQDLMAYAASRGDGDKTVLFRNLIDLFLTKQAPSKHPTRNQLLDVIKSLITRVDIETRKTAADLIAGMTEPPTDLAAALSVDVLDVAEPLLTAIPFDEDELVALIPDVTKAHHQIIASRTDLSANVWIALARASRSLDGVWQDQQGNMPPTDSRPSGADPVNPPVFDQSNVTPIHPGRFTVSPIEDVETGEGTAGWPEMAIIPAAPQVPTNLDQTGKDSSNKSWGFSSDRDGFVQGLCSHGRKIAALGDAVIGSPLLDFLGLNAKLGHPVARAFQRRSAIHDAPIYLGRFPKGQRYWTLSASPHFDSATGSFAGYQGRLSSALRGATDRGADRADTKAVKTKADKRPAAVRPDTLEDLAGQSPQPKAAREAVSLPPLDQMISDILQHSLTDRLEKEVKAAVQEKVGSAVAGASVDTGKARAPSSMPKPPSSMPKPPSSMPKPPSSMPKPPEDTRKPAEDPRVLEALEALESLDQALAALRDDAAGIKPTNRMLQTALAETCSKVLRQTLI